MRTSVPQVLWIPDLETYDYKVFISYDSLFLRHKEAPPGIRGVRSWRSWTHPCVNKEGEYPIQLDQTLFWGGAPYTRIVEDRLIVRKDWGEGVQSLSSIFGSVLTGTNSCGILQRRRETGSSAASSGDKMKIVDLLPLVVFWMEAQKEDSIFVYPSSVCYGNPKDSPQGLRTNFCEQVSAITYEPDEDITTGLILLNPQTREVRHTVRVFPEDPNGGKSELKVKVPAASSK